MSEGFKSEESKEESQRDGGGEEKEGREASRQISSCRMTLAAVWTHVWMLLRRGSMPQASQEGEEGSRRA